MLCPEYCSPDCKKKKKKKKREREREKKSFKVLARKIHNPLTSLRQFTKLLATPSYLQTIQASIMTFLPSRIFALSHVANSSFFSRHNLSQFFFNTFDFFCDSKLNLVLYCYFKSINFHISLPINPHSIHK